MPHTKPRHPIALAHDETPGARLYEGALGRLLGYQVAQASVATLAVFDEVVGRSRGLRTVEYTVLALIDVNGTVSPAQLARALRLSPSYITMALDKLEDRGLILRQTNERDRRGQRLLTTAEGSRQAAEMTALLIDAERRTFGGLSEAEQLMLAELLHKLARHRTER